jgi:hypothetical protein
VALASISISGIAKVDAQEQTVVIRDSVLLTGPRTIAPSDFIHIYDSTPYHIMKGHVALRAPCNEQNETSLQVLIGQAPNKPATLEFVGELLTSGDQCLYHVDIESHTDSSNPLITDVAIRNAGTEDLQLTDTSTAFVGGRGNTNDMNMT